MFQVEQLLESLAVRAQKELILLWGEENERPQRTAEWLDVRGWVSSHYHLRAPHRMYIKKSPNKMVPPKDFLFVTSFFIETSFLFTFFSSWICTKEYSLNNLPIGFQIFLGWHEL